MDLLVGTSGFAYKEWKGSFYPEKFPASGMLRFYAERLPAVEINNTFYRMPKPAVLEGWAAQVPEGFRFVLKASRRITHHKRLKDAEDEVGFLYRTAATLGERLGAILFQLPPYLHKDLARLERFLAGLPSAHAAAFEFRHPSWFEDDVVDRLRDAGAALCCADTGEGNDAPLAATAEFGYLRLRRTGYDEAELGRWVQRISAQPWERAFVFFKHEDAGVGPALAARFQTLYLARAPRRVRRPRRAVGEERAS